MDKKITTIKNGCGGKKGSRCQIIYIMPHMVKQVA